LIDFEDGDHDVHLPLAAAYTAASAQCCGWAHVPSLACCIGYSSWSLYIRTCCKRLWKDFQCANYRKDFVLWRFWKGGSARV